MKSSDNPFVFLENMPPSQVAEILGTELAFVQGAALCMMPPATSAKIMASMDDMVRRDVAAAMGKSRQMPRDVLMDIADELRKKCPAPPPKPQKTLGESIANLQDLIKGAKSGKNTSGPAVVPARIIQPGQQPQGFSSAASSNTRNNSEEMIRNAARTATTHSTSNSSQNDLREQAMQEMLEQARNKRVVSRTPAASPAAKKTGGKALKLSSGAHKIDGMALAAHILREADASVRKNVMHELPELYNKLHEQMFDFADLEHSDKVTLGKIFTNVDLKTAAMALRFASEELQLKVYNSISKNRAAMIRDEIESSASEQVRLSAIDEAQQAVIEFALTLQDKGQIVIDPNAPDLV